MGSFLTPKQIDNDRIAIYSQFLEKMGQRGGTDFRSIRPSDVKWLFDSYDLTFFKGQMTHRLETTHGEITFHVRGTSRESECGYSTKENSRHYFFDISTSIFKAVGKNDQCPDRALCLMHVVEHQIIHFLMLLYDYHKKIPGNATYSAHGQLYQCMLRMFFGDVDPSHDLKGEDKARSAGQIQTVVAKDIGRFSNVRNSCFLDSLLFVLLISDGSNYIRPILFDSDIDGVPYNVKSVCDRSRTIKTRQQVRDLAHEVRNMLETDYQRLRGGDVFQCNNLRRELRKCDPEIGTGGLYTPTEVYGIFAHLYPKLQVYFPLRIVVTENAAGQLDTPREDIGLTLKITFSDLEYTPFSIKEYGPQGPGTFYLWENINEPLLVFHNTGQNIKEFSEYIIKRRYRLFGVVMSRGRVSKTGEGGGHYNAYVRIDGQWFFYDDMGRTTLSRLKGLPTKEVFGVGRWGIAELLFYERIEEIPSIPVKATGTEKDDILYEPIKPYGDKFCLIVKYQSEYAGRIIRGLGGKLKLRGNHRTASWLLNYDDVENKKDEIENAIRTYITISPQGDSVMIYAEDRYGFLEEKFRNLGGKLVEKGVTYIGLNYHLRNKSGVSGDVIQDYYWRVPRENFNDTLAKIQKA